MNISELTIGHIGQRIQVDDREMKISAAGTLLGIEVTVDKIYSECFGMEYTEPQVGRQRIRLDIGFQELLALSSQATFILEGEQI